MAALLKLPQQLPAYREQLSRMLFELRAVDCARSGLCFARTGQVETFTRASDGRLVDALGNMMTARHSAVCIEMWDADADNVRELATLRLEHANTSPLLHNNDFSTWTPTNSPAVTVGAIRRGDLSLDNITDNSGTLASLVSEPITFTGDGIRCLGFAATKGLFPALSGTLIQVTDTTSSADRVAVNLTWDGSGNPIVSVTTGNYIGPFPLGPNIWWFVVQSTSITAAHSHTVKVTPAQTAGQTGDVYLGGLWIDNQRTWTMPLNQGASTVPRSADLVSAAIDFLPQPCTFYGKVVLQPTASGGNDEIVRIGTPALLTNSNLGFGIYRDSGGTNLIARLTNNISPAEASVAIGTALATAPNGTHEMLATWTWSADTNVGTMTVSFDGGTPVSASIKVSPTFTQQTLQLPGDNNVRWVEAKLAAGVRTLDQMRSA